MCTVFRQLLSLERELLRELFCESRGKPWVGPWKKSKSSFFGSSSALDPPLCSYFQSRSFRASFQSGKTHRSTFHTLEFFPFLIFHSNFTSFLHGVLNITGLTHAYTNRVGLLFCINISTVRRKARMSELRREETLVVWDTGICLDSRRVFPARTPEVPEDMPQLGNKSRP